MRLSAEPLPQSRLGNGEKVPLGLPTKAANKFGCRRPQLLIQIRITSQRQFQRCGIEEQRHRADERNAVERVMLEDDRPAPQARPVVLPVPTTVLRAGTEQASRWPWPSPRDAKQQDDQIEEA
ncbi:MAG: hypothetical protein R3A10_23415 [Caldilineaceae bacterium]